MGIRGKLGPVLGRNAPFFVVSPATWESAARCSHPLRGHRLAIRGYPLARRIDDHGLDPDGMQPQVPEAEPFEQGADRARQTRHFRRRLEHRLVELQQPIAEHQPTAACCQDVPHPLGPLADRNDDPEAVRGRYRENGCPPDGSGLSADVLDQTELTA